MNESAPNLAERSAPTGPTRPRRIGIVLNGLEKKANTVAIRYLVLQMNRLQRTFEYEFLPFPEDDYLESLRSSGAVSRSAIRAGAPEFQQRYVRYLTSLNGQYSLKEAPPDYFVVVCLATFDDDYYATRQDGVSVIALGRWERHMAPPSIVEFLLTIIVREAVSSVSPQLRGSVHLGTKGCLFDFTYDLDDVRFKVLNAFVCNHCVMALTADHLPRLPNEIQKVLSKKWLGLSSKAGSPAAIASKLGHDLFTTKGLQPTFWEQLLKVFREEGTKQVLAIVGIILGAFLLAWLGLKTGD